MRYGVVVSGASHGRTRCSAGQTSKQRFRPNRICNASSGVPIGAPARSASGISLKLLGLNVKPNFFSPTLERVAGRKATSNNSLPKRRFIGQNVLKAVRVAFFFAFKFGLSTGLPRLSM